MTRPVFNATTPENLFRAQLMQAFQEIENERHTRIMTDEDGTRRIIIGRLPDNTVGIVISEDGVDVLTLF